MGAYGRKTKMTELDTMEKFKAFLESGKDFKDVAVQGLDLASFSSRLRGCDFSGGIFLGCKLENDLVLEIIKSGGLHFPEIDDLPYKPFRGCLYTRETLFDHFDPENPESYGETTDGKIYEHYIKTGKDNPDSILETLARRLHDHSITDALTDFLHSFGDRCRVVAVMGGHSLSRACADYKKVAHIAHSLSRSGYLVVTGGGPGAMEAAHLGVWFSGYERHELEQGIQILADAPSYKDKNWLAKAFTVIKTFPFKKYNKGEGESIGVPTWLYGHEPPTPFASQIAKYFANSVREEGVLAIAKGGVIFAPGSAGTIQEVFQDACQNHYKSFGNASPMVFLNEEYWKRNKPVYPLLAELAAGKEYADLLSISDNVDSIVKTIKDHRPSPF